MSETVAEPKKITPAENFYAFMTHRRGVLKGIFRFALALGLGGVLYGMYRFLAPGAGSASPVEIPLSEIPVGGSLTFQYGTIPGIVLREEEEKFKAFSLICTHMACTVVWNEGKKEFFCPCHDGYFDAEGNVISGPPPTPLERFRVEVRGEKVWIGEA